MNGRFTINSEHTIRIREMLDPTPWSKPMELPIWEMQDLDGTRKAIVLCRKQDLRSVAQKLGGNHSRRSEGGIINSGSIKIPYGGMVGALQSSLSTEYILLRGEDLPFIAITSDDHISPWFQGNDTNPVEVDSLEEELNTIAEELDSDTSYDD